MARTKFTFEKRQREIARQQKQKDKAARRAEAKQRGDDLGPALPADDPDAPGGMNGSAPSGENALPANQENG
jgi:hypothetical protein